MTQNDEKQPVEEAQTPEASVTAVEPASQPTAPKAPPTKAPLPSKEIGGPTGPEPTRYGDWERNGRVSDF